MGKYYIHETGRDIIDDIAVVNASRNIVAFENSKSLPMYFGGVEIGTTKVTLDPITNKKNIGKEPIIVDIINGTKNFNLSDEQARIIYMDGEITEKTLNVHPTLIKLLKTCVASSYNVCKDYSTVVSAFVKQLLDNLPTIILPLDLPAGNKLQKIIGSELNEFLKEICDTENIDYQEIVEKPKKTKKKDALMDAAEAAGGC